MDQRPATGSVNPAIIRDPLRRLRAKARFLLVVQRISVIGASILGALAAFTLLDFLLRFPTALRATVLIGAIAILFWLIRTRVRPALLFAPRLTDLALRVEQRYPSMKGRLASALEFADWSESKTTSSSMVGDTGKGLARIVVERTAADMGQVKPSELIKPAGAKRSVGSLGLVLALLIAAFIVSPAMSATGASRTLAPWSGAEWPKRTGLADATEVRVHPIGRALALRAVLTKSPRSADRTDVLVQYRLTTDGETGPLRRELLTHQSRDIALEGGESGPLFERLIEPVADRIEYRFSTDDDTTPWRTVRLVPAPSVIGASATITPPGYTSIIATEGDAQISRERTIELGPGTDDRAIAPGALIGSQVELTLRFNKAASIIGELAALAEATNDFIVEPDPSEPSDTYTARFTLRDSVRLQLDLIDADEIGADETATYRFDALPDRPAAATIVDPATDRSVLPSAVLTVRAEGRDDVGLYSVAIEQQRYAPAGAPGSQPSGPGGALDPVGDPVLGASREASGERLLTAEYQLDLATIEGIGPGNEIHLIALAVDVNASVKAAIIPTRSPERILRIISEEEFVAEVRDSLSAVRESAIRTDQQQERVTERTASDGASRAARREQAAVSQRLAQAQRDIEELSGRIERNRLDDATLEELLDRVSDALSRAGSASTEASSVLDKAGARADREPEPADPENPDAAPLTDEERETAEQAQTEVRDELSNIVGLLDRGEDDWVIRNTLDRLIDEQRELQEETGQAGAETAGLRPEELIDEQRQRLEDIAERQEELSERASELIEQMRQRSQELSQTDPAGAEAMQQAADSAEQNQVPQNMQQAASEAQQNQTQQAQQAQQEAIDALEQTREELDDADNARAEVLRRVLASVIQSLEGLIADQTVEIANLDAAAQEQPIDPQRIADLGPAMIRLNTNTAAVADLVRSSGNELIPVLNLVQRAVDAQVDVIVSIRSGNDNPDEIRAAETRSLDQLQQALERAKALDEQLAREEQERKKRELKEAYLEALRATTEMQRVTEPYANAAELNRRDRAELRRLSSDQGEITTKLESILTLAEELQEASVFMLAHRRAESLSTDASDRLTEAQPAVALQRQRALAQILTRILEALQDPEPDEEPFEEGQSGGQAGGQGGSGGQDEPLIAPVQELKLLRMIQIELAEATAVIETMPEAEARREIARLASEQRELTKVAVDLLKRAQAGGNLDELFPEETRIDPQEGNAEPGEPGDEAPEPQPEGPQP